MVVLPGWSLVFSMPLVQGKIEVSSLVPEHDINHGELQFLIGLPADWQSSIGPLYLNRTERVHLQYNSCFIFLFNFLYHQSHGVGVVFNKKITYWLQFLSWLYHRLVSWMYLWQVNRFIFPIINSDRVLNFIIHFCIFSCRFLTQRKYEYIMGFFQSDKRSFTSCSVCQMIGLSTCLQ
jgi:hypothetical protein